MIVFLITLAAISGIIALIFAVSYSSELNDAKSIAQEYNELKNDYDKLHKASTELVNSQKKIDELHKTQLENGEKAIEIAKKLDFELFQAKQQINKLTSEKATRDLLISTHEKANEAKNQKIAELEEQLQSAQERIKFLDECLEDYELKQVIHQNVMCNMRQHVKHMMAEFKNLDITVGKELTENDEPVPSAPVWNGTCPDYGEFVSGVMN